MKVMQEQLAEQRLQMEELARHSLDLQAKLDRAPSPLAGTSSAAAPMSSYEPPVRRKRTAGDVASPAGAAKQPKLAAKTKGKGKK